MNSYPRPSGRGSIDAPGLVRVLLRRRFPIHVYQDVAPLKPRVNLPAGIPGGVYPRPSGRGSIEAVSLTKAILQ